MSLREAQLELNALRDKEKQAARIQAIEEAKATEAIEEEEKVKEKLDEKRSEKKIKVKK